MEEKQIKDSTVDFEKGLEDTERQTYVLRLYIQGQTPKSLRAIENIEKICKEHLAGRYELEIIDATQHPEKIEKEQILAIPTLIKKLPLPLRRFIGDLSHRESILVGLNLHPRGEIPPES
jgi:circadian clock protein KaiB